MNTYRALLALAVVAVSLEVSGQVIDSPPVCVSGNHLLQKRVQFSEAVLSCPRQGSCDYPSNRDAAIPNAETPIKYLTVKFQSLANDNGSDPLFSRADAVAGLEWLNACYEPWRIQFVFDHRMIYSSYFHEIHEDWNLVSQLGHRYAFDIHRTMNVFTTNFWCEWEGQYTLCGGAMPPWDSTANTPPFSVLMTPNHWPHGGLICHEVGHNFGLLHTFGDFGVAACGPCDEVVSATDRDHTGDFCSDTPPTPVDPWNTRCAPAAGTDRCSGRPWGETDYRNWMAYTPYAPCKDHFTAQQAGRMHCWLEATRGLWISYAKIEPDVDFGPGPLEVRFSGVTSMRANEWSWDFGDGTVDQGQSPSHVYTSPGIYTPTVMLDAAEGEFEATMSRDVWVYSGAAAVDDVEVPPGALTVEVPVSTTTSVPVDSVILPLHWDGPANLIIDSVSTAGLRSASFPPPRWLDLDPENGRGCLRIRTVDSLAMAPSEGELLKLVFTVGTDLDYANNEVRLADYGSCRLRFITDRGTYIPTAIDGSVRICEGRKCDRELAARRPTARRHP
jgi:hypothetical protein